MADRLTHVLVECPALIASVQVGVLNALAPMEGKCCEVRFRETRRLKRKDIQWCDIFVCVRGSEALTEQIVSEIKRHKRLVLYFLDDDLLHLPETSLSRIYFDYEENRKALVNILAQCDGLWGVNEEIRNMYLPLCGCQRWISSRVPIQIQQSAMPAANQTPVKVLYAGSEDHQDMVREILLPAIQKVIEQCGDTVEFTFIGPNPQMDNSAQVQFYKFFEDYNDYRSFVENGNFQIGLAPMLTGQFYQCKYYNKFVEYTSIGAAGIYTDCPLYKQIIRSGENGLLCENTKDGWVEAIIRLVEQPELRRKCIQSAETILQEQFQPEQVSAQLLRQIPELETFRAPEIPIFAVAMPNPWLSFYMGRCKYLFHQYRLFAVPIIGFKAVKKIVQCLLRSVCRYVQRLF